MHYQKVPGRGAEEMTVKNTDCFSRELGLDSQHLHGGSQPSVTPSPGIQIPLLSSVCTRNICGTQGDMQTKHPYMFIYKGPSYKMS